MPSWSPDGREIAFSSLRGGYEDIWIVPTEGGEPRQLTDDLDSDYGTEWSPDGEWIFEFFNTVRRIPVRGGPPEIWYDVHWGSRLSVDGRDLYHIRDGNIWVLAIADGSERLIAELASRPVGGGLATDGEFLYFMTEQWRGDIWVMDVVQNEDDGSDD